MGLVAIGIDSGGTRMTCTVISEESVPVFAETTSSIADSRDASELASAAAWITDRVTLSSRPGDDVFVWIGAAIGLPGDLSGFLRRGFADHVRQLEKTGRNVRIALAGDAASILKAPPLLGSGIAAIVGTGSIVLGSHHADSVHLLRRGGYEWPVGDEGSGVWMTTECVRRLVKDLEFRGSRDYESLLLEELSNYFSITIPPEVPQQWSSSVKLDMVSLALARVRDHKKRFLAAFAYPHIFELAGQPESGPSDAIAAAVLADSVKIIGSRVNSISSEFSASTRLPPKKREPAKLVLCGSIAANPMYAEMLSLTLARDNLARIVGAYSEVSARFASLAWHCLIASEPQRDELTHSLDAVNVIEVLGTLDP